MLKVPSLVEGHVVLRDAETREVLVSKKNAINYESMSEALALGLANRSAGNIHEMVFGNGASSVSGTGAVTYFPPNVTGSTATLYNQTYSKVVNDQSPLNTNPSANFLRVVHTENNTYSDIVVTCTLDYAEPAGQNVFDDTTDTESAFVFDEIGLKSFNSVPGAGKLLTHVVFHPVQKSLNRTIEVEYTLRIYMT
jgi:hypothetical protein